MRNDIKTVLRQALPANLRHHLSTLIQLLAETHLGILQGVVRALEGKRTAMSNAGITLDKTTISDGRQ